MRFCLSLILILVVAKTSLAAQITCTINPQVAHQGGFLWPSPQFEQISTMIQSQNLLLGIDLCTSWKASNKSYIFCAANGNFLGGYDVALLEVPTDFDNTTTTSALRLGTSTTQNQLISITSATRIINEVYTKLIAAGIEIPEKLEYDPTAVDRAIQTAIDRSLLTPGQTVLYKIEDCFITP
jgi:hypothetical protein